MQNPTLSAVGARPRSSTESILARDATGATRRLACTEVWGSNSYVETPVELPGLSGWIYSNPLGSGGGGDLHYMSVCVEGDLSRVVLADVSGHGEQANPAAAVLRDLMRKHIDHWGQAEFMGDLNQTLSRQWGGRPYASVVMLGYRNSTGELAFTNAGHPAPFWRKTLQDQWVLLEEGASQPTTQVVGTPVGMVRDAAYTEAVVQLAVGDLLLLYTDGLTEAVNDRGEEFGTAELGAALNGARVGSPRALGMAVLAALADFCKGAEPMDDQTLILLKRSKSEQDARRDVV